MIGGVILAAFTGPDGWRSVFYVNVPIGLAALLLAARFVPSRTVAVRAASTWTWSGSLLLDGGVLGLLLPLVEAETGSVGGL